MKKEPNLLTAAMYSFLQPNSNPYANIRLEGLPEDIVEYLKEDASMECVKFFTVFYLHEYFDEIGNTRDVIKFYNENGKLKASVHIDRDQPFLTDEKHWKRRKILSKPHHSIYLLDKRLIRECKDNVYCPWADGSVLPPVLEKNYGGVLLCAEGLQYLFELELLPRRKSKKLPMVAKHLSVAVMQGREVLGFEKVVIRGGHMRLKEPGFYKQFEPPGTFVSFVLNFLVMEAGKIARKRRVNVNEKDTDREVWYVS